MSEFYAGNKRNSRCSPGLTKPVKLCLQIPTMLPFMHLALTLFTLITTTFSHPTESIPWHSLASIPLPRQEHTTVFLAPDTLAVLGGIIPSNFSTTLPIITTPLMQLYSIENNTWTTSAPLPRAMNHINAAVAAWLNEATVPQQLSQQLEYHILHDSTLDDATLSELSLAYEVLQVDLS